MQVLRIALGGLLALALSALSAVCCFRFGQHLASGDEGFIYAVLGATADALKSLIPLSIAASLSSGQKTRAVTGALLFLVFSAYSLSSEIGLYALSRDAQASSGLAGKEAYEQIKTERQRIQARLASLGTTRPRMAIDAELEGLKNSKVWHASNECRDASTIASRTFCGAYEKLRSELATATEDDQLRRKDEELSEKMSGMDLNAVLKTTDPQAEALSRMTGVPSARIKDTLAVLVSLLLELGSGLGLWVMTASSMPMREKHAPQGVNVHDPGIEHASQKPSIPVPSVEHAPSMPVTDAVAAFARAVLRREANGETTASAVHEAYVRWSQAEGHASLSPTTLGRKLRELKFEGSKRGGVSRYSGVSIVPEFRLN